MVSAGTLAADLMAPFNVTVPNDVWTAPSQQQQWTDAIIADPLHKATACKLKFENPDGDGGMSGTLWKPTDDKSDPNYPCNGFMLQLAAQGSYSFQCVWNATQQAYQFQPMSTNGPWKNIELEVDIDLEQWAMSKVRVNCTDDDPHEGTPYTGIFDWTKQNVGCMFAPDFTEVVGGDLDYYYDATPDETTIFSKESTYVHNAILPIVDNSYTGMAAATAPVGPVICTLVCDPVATLPHSSYRPPCGGTQPRFQCSYAGGGTPPEYLNPAIACQPSFDKPENIGGCDGVLKAIPAVYGGNAMCQITNVTSCVDPPKRSGTSQPYTCARPLHLKFSGAANNSRNNANYTCFYQAFDYRTGPRCALPCVSYHGFDEAYWQDGATFCPCLDKIHQLAGGTPSWNGAAVSSALPSTLMSAYPQWANTSAARLPKLPASNQYYYFQPVFELSSAITGAGKYDPGQLQSCTHGQQLMSVYMCDGSMASISTGCLPADLDETSVFFYSSSRNQVCSAVH